MSRLPTLDKESMSEAQKALYEAIASGPRGSVRGPFEPLLHGPGIAQHVQRMGAYLRYEGVLSDRLRELAILVTGRFWTAQYEWFAHRPIAEKAGLDPAIADAIANRKTPSFSNAEEQAVYDFATELHKDHKVSDTTFAAAREAVGDDGIVELTVLCGYYTIISMTLNTFEVDVPGGERPLAD